MIELLKSRLSLVLMTLLLAFPTAASSADIGPADLEGEDLMMFQRFRELFQNGTPDEFFEFAKKYEEDLHKKGYMMLYYKLQNNEGFFALRHRMIYRAMMVGERLDKELHKDGASRFYYLATGLMGDIYYTVHNRKKAEQLFIQALEEVGDDDPKFSMRTYQSLAEMLSVKDPDKAVQWMDKSMELARKTANVEYLSLSLAMTAYVYFMKGDAKPFYRFYDEYLELCSEGKLGFNHRYDKILDIAKMSFDGRYHDAMDLLKNGKGTLYADSSLVAIHILAMERNLEEGFEAMRRRNMEMDSIFSIAQELNFDQMATERALLISREEALINKKLASRLVYWLIGLTAVYVFVYLMGRRRLMRKIWARNRELKVALAKAQESDHMKMAFIRSMSHEIRTPLNAVAGFSQILCNNDFHPSEEEKADMQKRITDNVGLVTTIVNEILELSKSESEGLISDEEKADVGCNELGRSVLQDVKGKQNTGVELRFSSNVIDDFVIHTNGYRLKAALKHLVDNALKFTDTGYVELRCEEKDGKMLFSVTDTGVGISPEDREKIFDSFFKADDFAGGIGLGLPICRRLINSLGGNVTLDPDYTKGSRFVISLPV